VGPNERDRPAFVNTYTIVLYVLAGFALLTAVSHGFIIRLVEGDDVVVLVLRFVQTIEAIIFLFALVVAVLRTYRVRAAVPATVALSILMIFWVPFGTAGFVYWLGWVRRRERQPW
jgi:uncharacterized membrane protein YobD (UPF0266 family)